MRIYALPDHLPAPEPDYMNYDSATVQRQEDDHRAALKAHLVDFGFTGKRTGDIYRAQIADGYAEYMLADGRGRQDGLIHLPYGDAYQCPDVQHLPKRVIVERIAAEERLAKMFAKKASA